IIQLFTAIGRIAGPANSAASNHPPGKTFRVALRWKDFVNHRNPRVPPRACRRGFRGFTAGVIAGTSTMAAKAKKTDDDEDDVDAGDDGAESTEAAKPKSKLKLILIIVGAVAVVGGGGGGSYFAFFRHKEAKPEVAVVKPP